MVRREGTVDAFHRRIQVGHLDIHFRDRDDLAPPGRPPVVLIHGQTIASDHVVPTLERLAPHMPVFAPDLPGYGDSRARDERPDVDTLAHGLVDWMDAIGLERTHLLGSSFGCAVATAAAMHHPHRFERLVLQGPTMDPSARGPIKSLLRAQKNLHNEHIPYPVLIEDLYKGGIRRAFATWHLMYTDPIEERLPRIEAPTLVVHGENDAILTIEWIKEVVRLLPNGRLLVIPDVAHMLVYNQPRRLADAMLAFFGIVQDEPGTVPGSGDVSALHPSR